MLRSSRLQAIKLHGDGFGATTGRDQGIGIALELRRSAAADAERVHDNFALVAGMAAIAAGAGMANGPDRCTDLARNPVLAGCAIFA